MAWIQTLQSRFRMLRGLPVSAPLECNPLASSLSPGSRSNKGRGKGGTIAIVFFCLKAVILKRRGKDNGVLWKSTTSDSSQGWLSSPAAEAAGGSRGVLSSETAPSRGGTAALPLAHLLFLSSFLGKRTSESPTSPYTLPTLGTLASLPNGVNQRIQAEDKHAGQGLRLSVPHQLCAWTGSSTALPELRLQPRVASSGPVPGVSGCPPASCLWSFVCRHGDRSSTLQSIRTDSSCEIWGGCSRSGLLGNFHRRPKGKRERLQDTRVPLRWRSRLSDHSPKCAGPGTQSPRAGSGRSRPVGAREAGPTGALPGGLGTPAAAAISSPPAPHPLGSAPGPAALLGSEEPGRRHASPNRTRPLFPRRPPGSA
ncbi:uncharacterized protein LOC116149518 [Camelus dromedarius]|uniref:uncharacterized protein LOC116149518 n=1 Tax=Camelus dromedarius TaxID=9838 RepID=UPI0031194012